MKKLKLITTDLQNNKYWHMEEKEVSLISDCMKVINIYPEVTYQEIEGFGGAFTEASAYNFSKLSETLKEELLEDYFGETGLKYNMGRVHINSSDFALGNYTYIEEGDDALSTFDIAHDKELILPMIKKAIKKASGEISFLASPWSPPAFMKTNGEMNNGGKLKGEYYEAWAKYFVKFIKAYREEGIDISSVTVQNEPMAVQTWDSCIYTSEEESLFVRDYLGPALEGSGLGKVDILIWDHNKEEAFNRVRDTLKDEKTKKYTKGVGVHWYTGDHFEALEIIKKQYPHLKLYFTEGCVEYSRFSDSGDIKKAEMYAHDMLGNLNGGINGFYDWNLLLDEQGGPNHVGNYCAAPILYDRKKDTLDKKLSYYYIGHFSKYIKKGAKRIGLTRYTDKVEAVAFVNPDGGRVVILLNKGEEALPITLREEGQGVELSVESHSIITITYK
ncbi:MAG: glycoside hydrolase family 30 beta sandwich domain-containing protein [Clostridiaceae bacterium]